MTIEVEIAELHDTLNTLTERVALFRKERLRGQQVPTEDKHIVADPTPPTVYRLVENLFAEYSELASLLIRASQDAEELPDLESLAPGDKNRRKTDAVNARMHELTERRLLFASAAMQAVIGKLPFEALEVLDESVAYAISDKAFNLATAMVSRSQLADAQQKKHYADKRSRARYQGDGEGGEPPPTDS